MQRRRHSDPTEDRHGVLATTGSKLSAVCFCDGSERKYLEARQWKGHRVVEGAGSTNPWWPSNLSRWRINRIFGPGARADVLVRDAGRWHERADCGRFARPARRSGVGARRPIDHHGRERSRRSAPFQSAAGWTRPEGFRPGVLSRSCVGAGWTLRCLLGRRHRHHVHGESRHGRRHGASLAIPDADARGSTPGFPAGRTRTRVLAREIQHKNLWLVDLETGAERQLTNLAPDFDIRDFDVSSDGRELVLERVQERSNVVLLELPQR